VSEFGDLRYPERLDVAILLLDDFHDCISMTLTYLTLLTRVLILAYFLHLARFIKIVQLNSSIWNSRVPTVKN